MLIPDIETLKKVVKINASMPWEAVEPYVNDAQDIYLEPEVGDVILALAEEGEDTVLREKVCRALGPLALALATDELGIQYGDSGITVDNQQGKRSPANEAKIAAAKANLFYRGMQALDRLLDYLARHPSQYPDYADHLALTTGGIACFIRSATEFQETGLVNIEHSTLTYRALLPTLRQLQECSLRPLLGDALCSRLLADNGLTSTESHLRRLSVLFLANKTAELHTSQTGRTQRADNGSHPEYQPVIRPIYSDLTETGNWFAQQAAYYLGQLNTCLAENAAELGIVPENGAMEYNKKENRIFTSVM